MSIVTLGLLVVVVVLLIVLLAKISRAGAPMLDSRLEAFGKAQERTERAIREEVTQSREEFGRAAKEQRQELSEAFKGLSDSFAQRMVDGVEAQKAQLGAFSDQLGSFAKTSGASLDTARTESATRCCRSG